MNVRTSTIVLFAAGCMLGMVLAGCDRMNAMMPHKLVASEGQHSIPMYPDEATFLKISRRAQESGATGVVGDVQKQFTAKEIDDQTSVKILSSDDNGYEVQVTDGPMKGQVGFVAHQNVS
jgi:hypothetical protein